MDDITQKEAMDINDCPFCGSESLEDNFNDVYAKDLYSIECMDCGARSPIEKTPEKAVESWNWIDDQIRNLRKDCDRLRRELDDCNGVIR